MSVKRCLLIGLMLLACSAVDVAAATRDTAFERLDQLIAEQPRLVADKEARLERMKVEKNKETTLEGEYAAAKRLYEEYAAFQYDSAYAYVSECLRLAQSMDNKTLVNESRLNMARILSTACLMDKAQLTMSQVDTTSLNADQMIQYYRTNINMLIHQAEYMQGTKYADECVEQLIAMRRAITGIKVPHDHINYLLTLAECEADSQHLDRAISLLREALKDYSPGNRMYSIITSTLSFFCQLKGDQEQQMQYLIQSAESDLQGCVRENTSLRTIADRLFDEGDIDRAYRYMRVAVDDANFYGTRLRNIQASRIVPKILSAYQTKQERNRRSMMWLLAVISVIALLLVGGVVAIYQLLKRYRRLNEQNKSINEQLRHVNARLGDTVEQLHESNGLLQEREKLKEEYIARFLALSSRFIDRGEEQRKALYRLHRDRKTEELVRELKSTHFGNENAQLFYENFDNAFLNIYPNFVDKVNKLLQEDGKIEVKQGKRLTTESRVLALIRIGITDNQSIANILRASLTTIYTYRSKLKARAINKNDFENQVKIIDSNV